MRRNRQKLQVNTFPFLAVLLCAMGSLILFLLVMDRRAKIAGQNKMLASQSATAKAKEADDQQLADWEKQKRNLHRVLEIQRTELTGEAAEVQTQVKHAGKQTDVHKAHYLEIQKSLASEKAKLAQLEGRIKTEQDRVKQVESKDTQARGEILDAALDLQDLEKTLKEMKLVKNQEKNTFSVVPYRGKRGESRKPIYIECTATALVFHPDRKNLQGISFDVVPLRSEVERRAGGLVREKTAKEMSREPEPTTRSPYVLFLVRPDGIGSYYKALSFLKGFQLDFGYEFLDAHWTLDFSSEQFAGNDSLATTIAAGTPKTPPLSALPPLPGIGIGSGNSATPGGGGVPALPGIPGGSGVAGGSGVPALPGIPGGLGIAGGNAIPSLPGIPGASGSAGGYNVTSIPGGNSNPGGGTIPALPGIPGGSAIAGGSGVPANSGSTGGNSLPALPGIPAASGVPALPGIPGGSGVAGSGVPGGTGVPNGGAPGLPGIGAPGGSGLPALPGIESPSGTQVAAAMPTLPGIGAPGKGTPGTGGAGQSAAGATGSGTGISVGLGTPGSFNSSFVPISQNPNNIPIAVAGPGTRPNVIASSNAAQMPDRVTSTPNPNPGGPLILEEPPAPPIPNYGVQPPPPAPPSAFQPGAAPTQQGNSPQYVDPLNRLASPGLPQGTPPKSQPPLGRILGNRDFVITVDCYADHVTVFPSGTQFRWKTNETSATDQQIASLVKNLIARRQASVQPGEPPYRPQVRFQVSREGLRTYYHVYPLIEPLRLPMTRENLED